MQRFCVYTYAGDDGVVFYVGKGSLRTRRHRQHLHRATNPALKRRLAIMAAAGTAPTITIVAEFYDEQSAFSFERELIAHYGRRSNGGTLYNLTDGGDGASGAKRSIAERQRLKSQWASVSEKVNAGRAASWADASRRDERARNIKAALASGEVRGRMGASISKAFQNPSLRAQVASSLSKTLAAPAQKAKRAEESRRRWANQEFRDATAGKIAAGHNKWNIKVDGVVYDSAKQAAKALGVSADCVTLRCRKGIYERTLK